MGRVAACLGAVAALAAAGCGGGGDDGRLTHEEFAKKADAICAKYQKRGDNLPETEQTKEGIVRSVEQVMGLFREQLGELRALKPSKEDAEMVDRWVRAQEHMLRVFGKTRDRVARQETYSAAAEALELPQRDFAPAARETVGLSEQLDLRVCFKA